MRLGRVLAIMLMAAVAVLGLTDGGAAGPKQKGWRQLFNGKDMDGWEQLGKGKFVIEDGALKTVDGMGLLWYTREKFGNCTLRVVYKTSHEGANSGVFIRIADKPTDEWFAVHKGYEVQINDNQDEYHRTGAVYSLAKAAGGAARPTGEWNTMEITLKGPVVMVKLNGKLVNTFDPRQPVPERKQTWEPERGPRPEAGYIGLQNHDKDTWVWFKEVSVRPL